MENYPIPAQRLVAEMAQAAQQAPSRAIAYQVAEALDSSQAPGGVLKL